MKLAWSNLAKQEISEWRRFSIDRWGWKVTARYVDDIRDAAKRLANDPKRAKPLRDSFRILRVRSHDLIVYVDAPADRLVVARVLHTAMDIERHLSQDLDASG